jgi:putative ABC transport system permease protein
MRTPLALYNLWHSPVRSAVAVVGVTFAAVLMFMQLGFLEAVRASATVFYDALDFDLCIRSRDYADFADARTLPQARLHSARGARGVAAAAPLWIGMFAWRNPTSGEPRAILALGLPPGERIYRDSQVQALVDAELRRPHTILVDTLTRREFGPASGREFDASDIGRAVEINDRQMRIAGVYTQGTGLSAGGALLMSQRDFFAALPQLDRHRVSLGLLRLEAGRQPAEAARELGRLLPEDVEVRTREEMLQDEIRHWVRDTNYGLIFQSGVVVAFVVGAAIVYQVLSSEVASLMREYATLKAIGYDNRYLAGVMVQQSLLLALIAYALSVALSLILYKITAVGANIPIRMTAANLLLVLGLTTALCVVSGLAAIRKAFRADPAELF